MPRLGLGLGLNLPKPVYLGGDNTPVVPSGFVGQYLSYYFADFNLVTGDNVETWGDRSTNNNDLTQTTSANQPLLIEIDVVKQSTLANQPTLTDIGGGILAMRFDANDYSTGLPVAGVSDFTLEFTINPSSLVTSSFITSSTTLARLFTQSGIGNFKLNDDTGSNLTFGGASTFLLNTDNKVVVRRIGNNITAWVNDVEKNTVDVTGLSFSFDRLGRTSAGLIGDFRYSVRYWAQSVADPTNIVETPDFELLPQTQYLRNSAGLEASAGDDISAWQSTTHNQFDNVVRADATNDLMVGLPAHNALVFRKAVNTLGTQKVLFSSSTTSAQIRTNASNQIEVVSDLGTVFTFATSTVLTTQQTTILQLNGTNLELYESPTLLEAKDFTGETLTIDRALGSASDADWKEIWTYPNALNENSRNYFYYLRNDQNEILLPPLLPS